MDRKMNYVLALLLDGNRLLRGGPYCASTPIRRKLPAMPSQSRPTVGHTSGDAANDYFSEAVGGTYRCLAKIPGLKIIGRRLVVPVQRQVRQQPDNRRKAGVTEPARRQRAQTGRPRAHRRRTNQCADGRALGPKIRPRVEGCLLPSRARSPPRVTDQLRSSCSAHRRNPMLRRLTTSGGLQRVGNRERSTSFITEEASARRRNLYGEAIRTRSGLRTAYAIYRAHGDCCGGGWVELKQKSIMPRRGRQPDSLVPRARSLRCARSASARIADTGS